MAITRIANIASTIPDDSIANVKMANIVQYKNIIINGDMQISQRGTSQASITSSQYLLDRHYFNISGQGTWTMSQSTEVPTGQGFANSFKLDCTTADASPAASDYLQYQQRFEGQMLQYLKKGTSSAESLTLSFWIKSSKTGTYIAELYDFDNTRQISKSYTVSSADTWEKKTITFPGDTSGALDNNNSRSLDVDLFFGAGSDRSSGTLNTSWGSNVQANRAVGQVNLADSTSNEVYITGLQLEAGDTASEFEFLPSGVNLERCQRYYQKSYNLDVTPGTATDNGVGWTSGSGDSNGNAAFLPPFKTTMRGAPTVTGYARDGTSGQGSYFRNGASGNGTLAAHMYGQNSVSIYIDTGSGWSTSVIAAHYVLSAEI